MVMFYVNLVLGLMSYCRTVFTWSLQDKHFWSVLMFSGLGSNALGIKEASNFGGLSNFCISYFLNWIIMCN